MTDIVENAGVDLLVDGPRVAKWIAGFDGPREFAAGSEQALLDYARTGPAWTGSNAQLETKASGIVHLIMGSGDYQLV